MNLSKITKVALGAVLSISLLAGCTAATKDPKQSTTTAIGEPSYTYVKDTYFLVKDNKIVKQTGEEKQTEVIDWYFDPACPSCTKLDEIIKPKLGDITSKLTVRYHAMGFLSPKSLDKYSNRASAFILAVIEKDPEKGLDFFHSVMSDDFRPKGGEGNKTPDEKFEELYKKVGGTMEWKEIKALQEKLITNVEEQTALAFNSKDLISKAKDGRLTVPFIIIGDSPEALNFLDTLDAETFMLDSINKYVESKKTENSTEQTQPTEEKTEETKVEEKK